MIKTIQIALNDLSISLRERGIWVSLILQPIALIFLVGLANGAFSSSGGTTRTLIDVFDNDSSELSAQFLETLREVNDTLVLCPVDDGQITDTDGAVVEDVCNIGADSETSALTLVTSQQRLDDSEISAIIEIPAGFGQAIVDGQPLDVVYRSEENPTQPSALLQSVQAAAQRVSASSVAAQTALQVYDESGFTFTNDEDRADFRQQAYDGARETWNAAPATVAYSVSGVDPSDDSGNSGFRQSVPGMGTMYVMFTVLAGVYVLLTERKNWTLQRLMMMPVSRAQFLGGKLLARFAMGMIQYLVAFGFGILLSFVFDFSFGGNVIGLLLIMVAFSICVSAITFLLATLVDNDQQAAGITLFFSLTMAPLGGAWWPLEIVPDAMRIIGHISPVAWAMDGFNDLIFYNRGLIDVLPEVGVLLAMTAVIFGIAVSRFKYD